MRSFKVELLRFGTNTGVFQDRYLVTAGDAPPRTVEPAVEQAEVLLALDALRYQPGQPPQVAQSKIEFLTGLIAMFLPDLAVGDDPVHIDIVTEKVELWALPFEFAADKNGRQLLGDPERRVLLTRRVRRAFAEERPKWPLTPRVLFAWSGDVDKSQHRSALYDALEPWLGPTTDGLTPDLAPVMTELRQASLEAIGAACQQAFAEGRPYTHVHLLAHGSPLPSPIPELAAFRVALADGDVSAEQLAVALRAGLRGGPTVVTLAACDSSNAARTLLARGRVAYELHARGVPVVIGSQLPLTQVGAAVFARTFYTGILADTRDIRLVLCDARVQLKKTPDAHHDWASITAHLTLSEGYAAELHAAQLVVEFAKMNTASRWAQRIIEGKVETTPAQAERIERLLENRITALKGKIASSELRGQEATLENLGLLASCHKRLAELVFFRSPTEGAAIRSRELLAEARELYFRAHESALSHHWTGTQHLALCAVVSGSIPDELSLHFRASLHAASREARLDASGDPDTRSRVVWALGSLVELGLLAPFSASPASGQVSARDALDQLIALAVTQPQRQDALESTWRQLRRYVHWWRRDHGFFGGAARDLGEAAQELIRVIEPHVVAARDPVAGSA